MAVDLETIDDIGIVTINRPEVLNALDHAHYALLSETWLKVRDDKSVKAIIVTGAGDKAFCSGADLKSHLTDPWSLDDVMLTQKEGLVNRGLEIWKPIIAAVNGYCLGGGSTLLFATDIRIASPDATFALTETKRGLVPGNGGTQRILSQIPYAIAMEMLLTGDSMDAETALRWGLINRIVPKKDLMAAAMATARRLAANAPLAVQAAKELAVRAKDVDLRTGLRMEQVMNRLLQTSDDVHEGVAAFREKRAPKFKGT